jgi:hypothetical protein
MVWRTHRFSKNPHQPAETPTPGGATMTWRLYDVNNNMEKDNDREDPR